MLLQQNKVELFLHLLRKQKNYYALILELDQEIAMVLHQKQNLQSISALQKRKKIILDCIDEMDNSLKPLKNIWLQLPESDPLYPEIVNEIKAIEDCLVKITEFEEGTRDMLKQSLSQASLTRR